MTFDNIDGAAPAAGLYDTADEYKLLLEELFTGGDGDLYML